MNKAKVCMIISATCLIISSVCFVIHIVTAKEIAERRNCEHEYELKLNIPATTALYSVQKMWIPIYTLECAKCGKWEGKNE